MPGKITDSNSHKNRPLGEEKRLNVCEEIEQVLHVGFIREVRSQTLKNNKCA